MKDERQTLREASHHSSTAGKRLELHRGPRIDISLHPSLGALPRGQRCLASSPLRVSASWLRSPIVNVSLNPSCTVDKEDARNLQLV